jgi:hypothetical protein
MQRTSQTILADFEIIVKIAFCALCPEIEKGNILDIKVFP